MKENKAEVSDMLTEDERGQVEVLTVEMPNDKVRNRILMYGSSAVILFIVIATVLLWSVPKYSSKDNLSSLNDAYVKLQALEEEFAIFEDSEATFSQARLQNKVMALDEAMESLNKVDPHYKELFQDPWANLQELLLKQLPSEQLINKLPELQSNADREVTAFIKLLEGFSSELTQKRNFSLETIRSIDLIVANAYKIDASIVRILSDATSQNAFALSQLSEHVNLIQQGLNELRVGNPEYGIQSMAGTLEEETLNEAQFVYDSLSSELGELIANTPDLISLKKVYSELMNQEKNLRQYLQGTMVENFEQDREAADLISYSNTILIVVLCLSLSLLFLIYFLLKGRITVLHFEALSEREQNEKHENAILKLIDELEGLGNGDLSVELTVTDDSTGVIADSINVAVEQLRKLIEGVKHSQGKILDQVVQNHAVLEKSTSFQEWFAEEKKTLQQKLDDVSAKSNVIKKYFSQMTKDEGVLFQFIDNQESVITKEKSETIKKIFQMLSKVIVEIEDDVAKLTSKLTSMNSETEKFIEVVEELKEKNQLFTTYVSELDDVVSRFTLPKQEVDFKID